MIPLLKFTTSQSPSCNIYSKVSINTSASTELYSFSNIGYTSILESGAFWAIIPHTAVPCPQGSYFFSKKSQIHIL